MDNGFIAVFSQTFTLISSLALLLSILFFYLLKNHYSLAFRISLIGGCLSSLLASIVPSLALVFAISFLPPVIYHTFNPFTVAPFIIGIISFVGIGSLSVLLSELYGDFRLSSPHPRIMMTLAAAGVFILMVYCIHAGIIDYKIIKNSDRLAQYASSGNDPKQLERIYIEISHSNDMNLQNDLVLRFTHNPNASAELLRVIYVKTLAANLDPSTRNTILLSLSHNVHTPSDLLADLMLSLNQEKVPQKDMNLAVIAHNPNFSEETLLRLTAYPDCEIRRAIIAYPNISEAVLNQIIQHDPDLGVRHDAKRRLDFLHGISHLETDSANTPPQRNVIPDPLPIAADHSTDAHQLSQIYDDADLHDNTSMILETLAGNCYISSEIAHKIYTKANTLRSNFRTPILIALAANPKSPADILSLLAHEKDLAIVRALASNPNLPEELIAQIAPFPDCKIRKKLICIANIDNSVLSALRHDKDESVASEANARLNQTDSYLHSCRPIQKMNPSCQKYFDTLSVPDMQLYPNTSEAKPKSLSTFPTA